MNSAYSPSISACILGSHEKDAHRKCMNVHIQTYAIHTHVCMYVCEEIFHECLLLGCKYAMDASYWDPV
jgi:hypothetical protein